MSMRECVLKFEQDGKTLITGGSIKILTVEGLGRVEYDLSLKTAPQTDGAMLVAARTMQRQILITIDVPSEDRDTFLRFFPHKVAGKLTVTWNGVTRWIDYVTERNEAIQVNVHDDPTFFLSLLCPDPFFNDMDDFGKDITEAIPLIAFPFVWQMGRDFAADYMMFTNAAALNNRGDIETGMIVEIVAKGLVRNPRLALDDGDYLLVKTVLNDGDVLRINTNFGRKSVTTNGANTLHLVDRASAWLTLKKGINILSYDAEEGIRNMDVWVSFIPKYVGV